jgi:hypothetical protein
MSHTGIQLAIFIDINRLLVAKPVTIPFGVDPFELRADA